MRKLLALPFLALALAQPLPEALKKAPELPTVVTARLEYETRAKDLERTLQDPLRTPLAELQARQALALAEARLNRALAQGEESIASAYTGVLEAEAQVRLAQKALEVAELGLKATEIRLRGGGATAIDLLEAQNRLLEARKNLELAERGRESALAQLKNLLGDWKVEPLKALPPLPQEGVVEELLKAHADLLQLRNTLELLRFQRGLLDESFTPKKDIEALEDQLSTVAKNLENLERSLRVGLSARHRQLAPLLQAVRSAEEALKLAQERYAAEEKRFRAGLSSQLALLQQELGLLQAELSLAQARGTYLKAYYGLMASR
ncbi:outer membrane protein [Thermus oshimai JL-2]|uniref:Outer membrane protein n=1 Tax=Thermus oshimai JL-2 TaxID=751945 RepID=K7QVD1_THEOS|nr:TolC family protein [Thermus oshimai]AFV76451.1 outer membrane protein [Thermus oshimai JL-2]